MDYEKKYKDALAKAKDCLKDGTITSTAIDYISTIFPELKESEDERIRKALIKILNEIVTDTNYKELGIDYSIRDMIAWLRKQGEFGTFDVPQTPIKDAVEVTSRMPFISDDMKPIAEFIMGYANWDLHKDDWVLPTLTVPLFRVLDALIQRGKPYGEQIPISSSISASKYSDDECATVTQKEFAPKTINEYTEGTIKQKELKKTVDEFEEDWDLIKTLKFKGGDIVVNDSGSILEIVERNTRGYFYKVINSSERVDAILFSNRSEMEDTFHLWTIQDAKEGDVVVDKSDGTVGIFENIGHHPDGGSFNDPSYCFLHCRYDDGFFYADFEDGNIADSYDVIPATKEQRDLLFAEMEEAGYEWDEEKKKLRKIKPIWGTVDLRLPSGTLWATMNVGAISETDNGLYFTWGDTQGYAASQVGTGSGQKAFSWNDYVYGTENNLTKYNSTDGLTTLEHVDDVAYTFSDGQYVMPTKEQFEELIANTTSSWDSARSGYTFTSKVNGKSLFFPAAGGCFGGSVGYVESFSFYWASSLDSDSVKCSCGLSFDSEHMGVYRDYRCSGYSVRGVIKRKFSLYV